MQVFLSSSLPVLWALWTIFGLGPARIQPTVRCLRQTVFRGFRGAGDHLGGIGALGCPSACLFACDNKRLPWSGALEACNLCDRLGNIQMQGRFKTQDYFKRRCPPPRLYFRLSFPPYLFLCLCLVSFLVTRLSSRQGWLYNQKLAHLMRR